MGRRPASKAGMLGKAGAKRRGGAAASFADAGTGAAADAKAANGEGKEPAEGTRRYSARPLDATDFAILALVQEDSSRTDVDLAREVGLSASGFKKRLRKLERRGVIQRHVTLLNRNALDLGLLCFVQIYLTHHQPDARQQFSNAVRELPEVLECHFLTGEHDYMLKIVARDYRHLEHILADRLACIPGVDRLLTSIVLSELKRTTALPLETTPLDSP